MSDLSTGLVVIQVTSHFRLDHSSVRSNHLRTEESYLTTETCLHQDMSVSGSLLSVPIVCILMIAELIKPLLTVG